MVNHKNRVCSCNTKEEQFLKKIVKVLGPGEKILRMKKGMNKMQIEFEKQDLVCGIDIALRAVPTRTTMEILECLAIFAYNSDVKFIANNLELGIECYVKGSVIEPGSIAVNAKLFSNIIRKFPDSTITLRTDGEHSAKVLCEKVEFSLPYTLTDGYPILPIVDSQNEITLSQFTFKELIKQTIFCTSENDSRKIMTGELLECNNNCLKLASLDNCRLAIRNISLNKKYYPIKVIIPGKTMNDLSKILSDKYEDTMRIQTTDKHILFSLGSSKVVSRLIEGEFYDVERLISLEYTSKIVISRRLFLESLDRAILLISESEKNPTIVDIDEHSLKVKVKSNNGALNEEIDITKEGNNMRMAFNPRYLIDVLRVIDNEEIIIYYNTNRTPCIIRDTNSTYLYLISPITYQE